MKIPRALSAALGRTPADKFKITLHDNQLGFKALQALEAYDFFAFADGKADDAKIRTAIKYTVQTKNWTHAGRTITCYPKYFMFRGSMALNIFSNVIAAGIEDLSINGQTVV